MNNCKQWFEQGQRLGQMFVYWSDSQERFLLDYIHQDMLDSIKEEFNTLRKKVRAKHFSKTELAIVIKELDNLSLKMSQLHRF